MPFNSEENREKHIKDFYANLYKKRVDNLLNIESFLDNETTNCDWVLGKKLSVEEKANLEKDVELWELEKALKSSNLNSSTGWDGVSYKLLKFFLNIWVLLWLK